jgi:hypothetical protein
VTRERLEGEDIGKEEDGGGEDEDVIIEAAAAVGELYKTSFCLEDGAVGVLANGEEEVECGEEEDPLPHPE